MVKNMIINGIDFEVVVTVKKIKKIYVRVKIINNKYYLLINSFKKLSTSQVKELIDKNPKIIERLINNIKVNPLTEDEILILGKKYLKNQSNDKIKEAMNQIIEMFDYYKKIFNKKNTVLKFRKMKTRWGVCHITKNYINLSSFLIHVPLNLVEYVIIHEFCHFKFPNHNQSFYNEVKKYCPDYKTRIKELKSFSYVLT